MQIYAMFLVALLTIVGAVLVAQLGSGERTGAVAETLRVVAATLRAMWPR